MLLFEKAAALAELPCINEHENNVVSKNETIMRFHDMMDPVTFLANTNGIGLLMSKVQFLQ